MRKLSIIFIGGALLFFLLTPSYGEELDLKYLPKSADALFQKLKDDRRWTTDKQLEQVNIIEKMEVDGINDLKVMDRAKELAAEVYERIDVYDRDIAVMKLFFDNYEQSSVLRTRGYIAAASADMFVSAAEGYMRAGSLDGAKKICRMVITTYTGDLYKSSVKKAEFMLEDIKELEMKKEKPKNKAKNRK